MIADCCDTFIRLVIACRHAKSISDNIVDPNKLAIMQAKANRRLALLGRLSGSVMFFGCFAWNGVNFMYARASREFLGMCL